MSKNILTPPDKRWLEYIDNYIKVDFETGKIYTLIKSGNKPAGSELGCIDSNGYVKLSIWGKPTYAHQVVFYKYHKRWPVSLLDHIDDDRQNNRPGNLQEASHSVNAMKASLWKTNTTGYRGVSVTPAGTFKTARQGEHKGTYKTLREAANAYYKHS